MNLEIYPEDIEIFLNVLTPKIFEIGDRVFFDIDGEQEAIITENYSKNDPLDRSDSERQKDWNSTNVAEIFFNNMDNSSNETIMNIANLIKSNWEYYLLNKYPDTKFTVEIYGESFEPWITFYQP
nr:hypothetical protein [Moraxella bovis]